MMFSFADSKGSFPCYLPGELSTSFLFKLRGAFVGLRPIIPFGLSSFQDNFSW